jgi:hypothetical protein
MLSTFYFVCLNSFELHHRFPANSNCPDLQAHVTEPIEDENPSENYFFPDFDADSCGHGRNYPVSI